LVILREESEGVKKEENEVRMEKRGGMKRMR
jgi:hypothetical protein